MKGTKQRFTFKTRKNYAGLILSLAILFAFITFPSVIVLAQGTTDSSDQVINTNTEPEQSNIGIDMYYGVLINQTTFEEYNSAFDYQVNSALQATTSYFIFSPWFAFSAGNFYNKIKINYWEVYDVPIWLNYMEFFSISHDLLVNLDRISFGTHMVLYFSNTVGSISDNTLTIGNANFVQEDFFFEARNLLKIITIKTGYAGNYFYGDLFRAAGPQSRMLSPFVSFDSFDQYLLFPSLKFSTTGYFSGWTFSNATARNYIGILTSFTLKFINLDVDFQVPYSQNAANSVITIRDYFKDGLMRFHVDANLSNIGSFNLYFQPFIAYDSYYTTGAIILTYHYEPCDALSSYFLAFDFTPEFSFFKDLDMVISFDANFAKAQDERNSSRTGSGTITDPYKYTYVASNEYDIGIDARYNLNSLLKGLSLDFVALFYISSYTNYAVTNAAGDTWATYLSTLTGDPANYVMENYTELNYMINTYGQVPKMLLFLGASYNIKNLILSLGFQYINLYDIVDVNTYLSNFNNSNSAFPGRTAPLVPYGFFDRFSIMLKAFYDIVDGIKIGTIFSYYFYPGFPSATELGYASFTQVNGTVVSAEDQYKLDLTLPSFQWEIFITVNF